MKVELIQPNFTQDGTNVKISVIDVKEDTNELAVCVSYPNGATSYEIWNLQNTIYGFESNVYTSL